MFSDDKNRKSSQADDFQQEMQVEKERERYKGLS